MRTAILLIKPIAILAHATLLGDAPSASLKRTLLHLARLPRRDLAIENSIDFLQRLPSGLRISEKDVNCHHRAEDSKDDVPVLDVSPGKSIDLKV